MHRQNLLACDGEVFFEPQFFNQAEADSLFQALHTEIAWTQSPIKIFGKLVMQPRLTAWYGDSGCSYKYSGTVFQPLPWTPTLLEIKQRLESFAGQKFNSVLLNQYRDGQDSMGWHSDDEKELGLNPVIYSVNLGETRTFQFKHRDNPEKRLSIELTHGSLLVMAGSTQHHWLHAIPKTKKTKDPRINLTFRFVKSVF